jgi:two-component system phosphate regulon sensor histidine kinase PhoR
MGYFLLGLILGLSILGWRSYKINFQLNEILNSLSQIEEVGSLGNIAQIRRKVNRLNDNFYYTNKELELHHHLINNLPLGYLRINHDNYLIECNLKAQELLNIKRWQPNYVRFFLELVRSYELDQLIQQTRKTQKELVIEWQFFPDNNYILEAENKLVEISDRSLSLKAYSYPLPAGEISIFIENQQLIKDLITRRDQAYSDLSHELRTPLTSMLLLVETLLKYTDDKTKNWLEKIYQEINRLIDLVQNWLEIYQLEQNPYQTLTFQKLDLKQIICSAWKSVEILAEKENISLDYQGVQNISIEADLNRLTQVFVNLFDNSIKYCGQEGVIQVIVEPKAHQSSSIEINLIDSGVGFNPDDLPYIFERLYRGDKSRTRSPRAGTGLGLTIVKQIIEGHQGSIIARNHPQTNGAWFTIMLPLQQHTTVFN